MSGSRRDGHGGAADAPTTFGGRVRRAAATAPAGRDRYVDLLRVAAVTVVVLGHWVVSAVTVTDGRLGGVSILTLLPWTHPWTWLTQVMPVVFLVGGYANAASWSSPRRGGGAAAWVRARALRLLRPTAAFGVVLVAGYVGALALGADPQLARTCVWLATTSLWFLVVYLAVVALAPATIAWQRRRGAAAVLLPLVALVAAGDVARVVTGSPAPAAASYLAGWLVAHQLGVAWHDGVLTRSRGTAVALAAAGLAGVVVLTAWGPYAVTMVGAGPAGELDNTAPPTLALLALTAAWTGVVLLLRPLGERAVARPRVWDAVVGANAVVLTVFLWHTVPVVVAGLALVGTGAFPAPEVGSGRWFALRVPWVLVLAVLLVAVVAAVGRFELRPARPPEREPSGVAVGLGVVACLLGLLGLGVGGVDGLAPTVAGAPVAELALVVVGLVLLVRAGRAPRQGRRA
ncbi:acyltransferase [Cellulomonas sp.]|uniref:acyltransferase family protein n=1 Tax=Cellulomonas sp. TaxID=40001 RepID=UPI002812858B|nr:acyltransferase [Cellulomonas sp.]